MKVSSCGRPIIAAHLLGLRELVVEGEDGFLVDPRNVESLFKKIVAILDLSVERRVQMGRNRRKLVEMSYDENRTKVVYEDIMKKYY